MNHNIKRGNKMKNLLTNITGAVGMAPLIALAFLPAFSMINHIIYSIKYLDSVAIMLGGMIIAPAGILHGFYRLVSMMF